LNTPALALTCAPASRERPAGLNHAADESLTRATYAPPSKPPNLI
jgi:hypothetical protein